ncbi:MAG: GH39 family glycosyl hydrolase, partial [Burkholderiaceae bacterium]
DCIYGVEGSHETVDVRVSRGDGFIMLLATNYAMPRHPIATQSVRIVLTNAPQPRSAHAARIDEDHANPRRVWQQMGEPGELSSREVESLQAASVLRWEPTPLQVSEGRIELDLLLPPQSVAAVRIECEPESAQ